MWIYKLCAWRYNMHPPIPPPASWQYLRIYSPDGGVSACWLLRHQQQFDVWPFDLESGVRVTCDVGYLCANFSLPRPLCSRLWPDVRDRQTYRQTSDRRRTKASLNTSALWGGGIIIKVQKWNTAVAFDVTLISTCHCIGKPSSIILTIQQRIHNVCTV